MMIYPEYKIRMVENIFSDDECQHIIALGISESLDPAYVGSALRPDMRRSMIRFIYSADDNFWLFNKLWNAIKENYPEEDITTLNFLQFTEYNSEYGGFFEVHVDNDYGVGYNSGLYKRGYSLPDTIRRKITCVIQLSEPHLYDGGDLTIYPNNDSTISGLRDRGCAIMFPSTMAHQLNKVTLGIRYSLVGWFEGPK